MTDCPGVGRAPQPLLSPLSSFVSPPSLPAPGLPPQTPLPYLQVCFINNTYLNVFNSWILFYMSHIFYFVVPWDKCPLQKNSSDFGEEEVEK